MAILNGIYTQLRGSAGQFTFRRLNGQTVVSEKVAPKANPVRTFAQMTRRMQWKNLLNLYRAFEGRLHPSFEGKDARVSDYNEFVSANVGIAPVYLKKDDARQGACVVAAYQVTRGSLPSILVGGSTANPSIMKTDIALGASFAITASTTVKQFSDAVINANGDRFKNGDEITVFIAHQRTNAVTGIPTVGIKAQQVTLDRSDDQTLLRSVVDADGFSAADGCLGAGAAVTGGIAWIHSRLTSTGTKVSTQRFVVNNSAVLSVVQGRAALDAAIESYGGLSKVEYLTPDTDDVADIDDPFDNGGGSNPSPSPENPGEQPETAKLTLSASTPGALKFAVNGEEYSAPVTLPKGTTVALHAEPVGGYDFVQWRDLEVADPDYEFVLEEDTALVGEVEEA